MTPEAIAADLILHGWEPRRFVHVATREIYAWFFVNTSLQKLMGSYVADPRGAVCVVAHPGNDIVRACDIAREWSEVPAAVLRVLQVHPRVYPLWETFRK